MGDNNPQSKKTREDMERIIKRNQHLIPNYAKEYQRRYPDRMDQVIELTFQHQSAIYTFAEIEEGGDAFTDEEFSPDRLFQRWFTTDRKSFEQFRQRKDLSFGDIWEKPTAPYLTETNIHTGATRTINHVQILRNTPNKQLVYDFSRNYVFVGYVDLSQFLWGVFQNESEGMIRFYGYDRAEVTVARSMLIYEMMKSDKTEVSDKTVLQVWFSSCWDKEVKTEFENFVQLKIPKLGNDLLTKYAQCWNRKKSMTVKFAQDAFVEHLRSIDFEPLDNLKAEDDRMAFARYLFTGCIFTTEDVVCGNCTMFPDSSDNWKKMKFEDFFGTIDVTQLWNVLKTSDKSLIGCITSKTSEKFARLRGFIQEEKLVCHLAAKSIDINDTKCASEIKELNPYMIDWNNVPDYWHRHDFIDFAEKCSGPETVHHCHTMNWVQKVFGASFLDYIDQRPVLEEIIRKHRNSLNIVGDTMKVDMPSIERLIRIPMFKLPINLFSQIAVLMFGEKYLIHALTNRKGRVLNYFKGDANNFIQVFGDSATTMNCAFSFDSEMKFDYKFS